MKRIIFILFILISFSSFGQNLKGYYIEAKKAFIVDTTYVPTGLEKKGYIYWDNSNKTVSIPLENGVIGQVFKEDFTDGQNNTGSTIANGTPVSYAGSIGNSGNYRIEPTLIDKTIPAFYFIGITTETIPNDSVGNVTTRGKVRGIQTNGANYGETWTDSTIVYPSHLTAGYLTKTPPPAPYPAIPAALVISAHPTNGTLLVRPTYPGKIRDATDVNGTPLDTDGQFMVWDNVNEYFDFNYNINDYLSKPQYAEINRQGFLNWSETSVSFDGVNTFTLGDTGSGWSYYRNGLKYSFTGDKTVVLPGTPVTAGHYYIYIDDNLGTLTASTSEWSLLDSKIPVASVRFNNSLSPKWWISDERHTILLDQRQHYIAHSIYGTQIISPPSLSGYVLSTDVDSSKTFGITSSILIDQDIKNDLALFLDPNGIDSVYVNSYRNGISTWEWEMSPMPFLYADASYIKWDNAGTLQTGVNNDFYNTYLMATNVEGDARYMIVPGRGEFSTLAEAEAEDIASFSWDGFDIDEAVICYRLVWKTSVSYTSKGKCVLVDVQTINISTTSNPTSGAGIDHNTLDNLDFANSGIIYGHINDLSQSIFGVKTFDSLPISTPTPTTDYQLTNKLYVDNSLLQYQQDSDTTTFDGTKYDDRFGNTAYDDKINSLAFTGTTTKTLTLNQQDGGTVSNTFTDLVDDADASTTNELITSVTYASDTLTIVEAGNTFKAEILGGGGGTTYKMYYNHFALTDTIVSITFPTNMPTVDYPLRLRAYYLDTVDYHNTQIDIGMWDFTKTVSGFSVKLKQGTGFFEYEARDTSGTINYIVDNYIPFGVQVLTGTTPTWDVNDGNSARITISGNTTIGMQNLIAGGYGTLSITNPATLYTLNFTGYTFKIPNALRGATTGSVLLSGSSKHDSYSWFYNGVVVEIRGELNMIE